MQLDNFFHFMSLPSTQDKAFELLENIEGPLVVSADEQTKGRGRQQREWIHEVGRSLALSIGFRMPASKMEALSLVVGLGVLRALPSLSLRLKWPNDLILGDSKVGGILVESKILGVDAVVAVGIGINLWSLETAPYQGIECDLKVPHVSNSVWHQLIHFFQNGFSSFKEDYERVLWRHEQDIQLKINGHIENVIVRGIDQSGALIVENGGKVLLCDNGEILFAADGSLEK